MQQIPFAVSAKTARLIGRENISDVDGAIIELIKNSYDADAKCVFVMFDIPFENAPKTIPYDIINDLFDQNELSLLLRYYYDNEKCFVKKSNLDAFEEKNLNDFLSTKNSIIILDNGYGMNEHTLTYAWMNIGTDDKENNRVSPLGRIKTGAKGIGRFALDKLSKETTVYTKNSNDSLKKWNINWEQFETASLINEVTATIENVDNNFDILAKKLIKDQFKNFDKYKWDSGTIIILHPTREFWNKTYYERVNKNLKSVFPSTNDSEFDVFVKNIYYPTLSFENERFNIKSSEFDYKIEACFDGINIIKLSLIRNEIDTRKIKSTRVINNQMVTLTFNEFWKRNAFQNPNYARSDFSKNVSFAYSASDLTSLDPEILRSVGPFSLEFYFLRNTSSTVEISKDVNSAKRKEILNNYSGIKLYRDGFKVRPYGEEDGPSFDWLNLGIRAQKSPAAVSHPTGSWRVRSNQIIGEVRISKEKNPNLEDKANREGLSVGDSYNAFVSIINKVLECFEADRQYVYREYRLWIKELENKYSKTSDILDYAKRNANNKSEYVNDKNEATKDNIVTASDKGKEKTGYSKQEVEGALLDLEQDKIKLERTTKTMMLYSSSGVMTNTFSHEISRIKTRTGSRTQHLRKSIYRLLGNKEYEGNQLFNPLKIVDQIETVDNLLENWLSVVMSGTREDYFDTKTINVFYSIEKILNDWIPLLETKKILVEPITISGETESCLCKMADVDLLIIVNNIVLNAAYFLEKSNRERIISIDVILNENNVEVHFYNNGPRLDKKFAHNPNMIFEAGATSKEKTNGNGSGLGLWIVKTLVDDNLGTIEPALIDDGFKLILTLPKNDKGNK